MKKLLVLIALTALLSTACAEEKETGGESMKEESESKAEKIELSAKEYSFNVPSTIEGGFVTVSLKNDGKLKHNAEFLKIEGNADEEQFKKDLKTAIGGEGGIADTVNPYVGPSEVDAGKSKTWQQSLPAGDYFLVCSMTDKDSAEESEEEEGEGAEDEPDLPVHFEQGMIEKVKVTGPSKVELPEADATVTASEYTFDVQNFKAGENEILYRNEGPKEIHMAAVMEFPEGVDEQAAQKALESFSGEGPPPEGTPEPEDVGFSGIMVPGGGSIFEVNAKSGRVYAFVCFIQDRAGGPPHVAKGMAKMVRVG
ncbi:MAG: hypothetical protein ACRDIA_07350 [Actinomycetota bacterium]